MSSREDRQMNAEYRETQSTAAFMQDPNKWPNWPVLPVIRRDDRTAGIMIEQEKATVYVGVNMFDLQTGPLVEQLVTRAREVKEYDTFDNCALEWKVD